MEETKKTNENTSQENEPELNEDGVPRPVPDPKNKLYVVISLLIFAVLYFGWNLLKENITFSYSMYLDSFSAEAEERVLAQMGLERLPDGAELDYARFHSNFGSDCFYAAVTLSEEFAGSEDFPDGLISFEYGDVVYDSRFTVYPEAEPKADYIYGDCYVCIDDPSEYFVIYEENDSYTAVYSTKDISREAESIFDGCEKIPMK